MSRQDESNTIAPRKPALSGCPLQAVSRRRFLTGCAACAGAAAGFAAAPSWLRGGWGASGGKKLRVRIVYALHAGVQDRPDWPNIGFDFRPVMERTTAGLAASLPDFELLPATAAGPEEAKKILEADTAAPADGYLVVQLNCWNQVVQTFAETGRPVLYADFKYAGSGGFLVYTAGFLRSGARNLGFVASPRIEDLASAAARFREAKAAGPGFDFAAAVARRRIAETPGPGDLGCLPDPLDVLSAAETARRMRSSRILAVRDDKAAPDTTLFTIPVAQIPFAAVNEAWAAADKDESRAVADRWAKTAARVDGVGYDELVNSAAMYLGMRKVLKDHGANAITLNCLGGFYGGHIHAYPCLGFHELLNEGLVGACECDVPSTAAMVAVTTLSQGRPGYISDPVLDTASRRIIYAHCVATNRVFGPSGPANPFEIMTHSEDRQGASVRSLLPEGYMTTTVEVSEPRREILLHRAKAVGNDPDDRACRTKLVAEPVGDFEKMFRMWDVWGWHRVTFYGDLEAPIRSLADELGWKVAAEA
jgi:hypothetical protein